ncbi:pyrroline-5-carboxylate reductase [Salipaludibacillus sp. HK11]|uniref:pyrroline-5-carboxylate reductase n=1 Tax=Salipaludibacillus sp. HK11 TaxID=3394320 RepID=UPI0039FC391B
MNMNVTMIGAGSMAEALITGWLKSKKLLPENIMVTNHSNDLRLQELVNTFGVQTSRDQQTLTEHAHLFILACKPKDWESALHRFKDTIEKNVPLVSVMAGVTTESMENYFPSIDVPVIRTIPNTSAIVNASMTPFAIGKWVTQTQRNIIEQLFQLVGETAEVPEEQMDAMTALTGTGPAYIYYLMESMEIAAGKIGIEKHLARDLVAQTLLGASVRVQKKELSPAMLYQQIMSPGGTTEAGFEVLQEQGLQKTMIECIQRAHERSKELGESTGIVKTNRNTNA